MNPDYVPRRGDLVWVTFGARVGHEQTGRRPALVLSREPYNRRIGLFVCFPITSKRKGYPFEVPLPTGIPVVGVVLADQIKSFDWRERDVEFICSISEELCSASLAKLRPMIE